MTRIEALETCMTTGFTLSAMLAIAWYFPLPGERDEVVTFIERLRSGDPSFAAHITSEIRRFGERWDQPPFAG